MVKIDDIQTLTYCLELFDSSAPIKISERVENLEIYAQKLIKNAHNYYVANDGQIAGFISFYANYTDTAYLTIIAVEESNKGRGIGSNMLEYATTFAKEKGMKRMALEVHKQNSQAISFYKKKNFAIESYGEKSYFMVKVL